jgi:hypothetical protein
VPVLWWNPSSIVHNKKIKGWTMSPGHFQGTDTYATRGLVEVWLDE